jgi:hypothetical protein
VQEEHTTTNKDDMEEVMPELVGLVLSFVDQLSLVPCRFVCRAWTRHLPRTSQQPCHDGDAADDGSRAPLLRSLRQELQEAEEAELMRDYSKLAAANGWLSVVKWAHSNGCP